MAGVRFTCYPSYRLPPAGELKVSADAGRIRELR